MLIKKAQSVAEYAVFISMMVAAIATMQLYIKRGLQAKYADSADQIVVNLADPGLWAKDPSVPGSIDISTTPVAVSGSYQYEPFNIESRKTQQVIEDKLVYGMSLGGNVTRDTVTRTQNEIGDYIMYDHP